MKLTITNVDIADFGTFKCLAKNSLGETDGSIKLYREYPMLHISIVRRIIQFHETDDQKKKETKRKMEFFKN